MSELQKAKESYYGALKNPWRGNPTTLIYEYKDELEKDNAKMREALEFYMKYSTDSRNMGLITDKVKEALNNE